MDREFLTLEKYIWITEKLREDRKFNLGDYCKTFHGYSYGKKKFPARNATDLIDKLLDNPELGLYEKVTQPQNKYGSLAKRDYYLDPKFEVEKIKFSDNEELMKAIVNKISRTKSINPYFTKANNHDLNEKIKVNTDLCDKIVYKFTEIENYSKPIFIAKFNKILNAILENKRVRIKYILPKKSSSKPLPPQKVTPLRLVNYNGLWYLFGITAYDGKYRYFKLSRIEILEKIDKFDRTLVENFDDNILNENFGIGTGGDSLVAVIKFTGRAAQTIAETIWHPEQELTVCESDNSKIMKIKYCSNLPHELIGKVLQYGAEAEIIEPEGLRNEWKNRIFELYNKIMAD